MNQGIRAMALAAVTLLVAACDTTSPPSVLMVAQVNSLSLSTADTLVVTRALTNNGGNDVWVNVTAPAYEMKNASGQPACDVSTSFALIAVELVRVQPDSTLLDERKYALEDYGNCTPGSYTMSVVATIHSRPEGGEKSTLRTPPSSFTITAPPAAIRRP